MLSTFEEQKLEKLLSTLQRLHAVTLTLQGDNLTIAIVRYLLDEIIKEYPCSSFSLSSSADIIHHKTFETGLVKLQHGKVGQLNFEKACDFRAL